MEPPTSSNLRQWLWEEEEERSMERLCLAQATTPCMSTGRAATLALFPFLWEKERQRGRQIQREVLSGEQAHLTLTATHTHTHTQTHTCVEHLLVYIFVADSQPQPCHTHTHTHTNTHMRVSSSRIYIFFCQPATAVRNRRRTGSAGL